MTIQPILGSIASWLYPNGLPLVGYRAAPALAITLAFALVAWGLRAVTLSGAVAGAVVTFLICVAGGPGGFTVVFAVFAITQFATRYGLQKKLQNGLAEKPNGRHASQVLANVGVAALVAAPVVFVPRATQILMVAMTAALCEAAADTTSSEIGQVSARRAYMITGFRSVPAGTNGAVTFTGTLAGIIAALVVAFVAVALEVIRQDWALIAAGAGIAGMIVDSLLGATLEGPGRLGNDAVNFLSTAFSACLTLAAGLLMVHSW